MTKKRIEILAAIVILIGLVLIIVFLLRSDPTDEMFRTEGGEIADDGTPSYTEVVPIGPAEILPNPIARFFVERFGSFSTESNFQNIEDVLDLATLDLKGELESLLRDSRSRGVGSFYGVSTKVIGLNILEESEETAKIELLTQREESIDSPVNTSVRYQNIVLELVKLEGEWLVNSFSWN